MRVPSHQHGVYKIPHDFVHAARFDPIRRRYANIFVEGDSWFDYPGRNGNFFRRPSNLFEGLLAYIHHPCNWFDAAVSGYMTSQLYKHEKHFKLFRKRRVSLDLHLVSAGGNDVFDRLNTILVDQNDDPVLSDNLDDYFTDELDVTLKGITEYYSDLKQRRDLYHPDTPIVGHDYAPPTERDRPFTFLWLSFMTKGPWVNKALNAKGYTDDNFPNAKSLRLTIIQHIHQKLSETIKASLNEAENCYVYSAKDRGLRLNSDHYWDDEIHLTPRGNMRVSADILDFLQEKSLYVF